jgi:hypothetical protein
LAQYDYCSPRFQTVVIPRDSDPTVVYFPPCTRVKRCGGCAPAEVLACEPKTTSVINVMVMYNLLFTAILSIYKGIEIDKQKQRILIQLSTHSGHVYLKKKP